MTKEFVMRRPQLPLMKIECQRYYRTAIEDRLTKHENRQKEIAETEGGVVAELLRRQAGSQQCTKNIDHFVVVHDDFDIRIRHDALYE